MIKQLIFGVLSFSFLSTHSHATKAAGIILYSSCPSNSEASTYEWCVLLNERNDGTFASLGGLVDEGETEAQAAVREIFEETGFIYQISPETLDRIPAVSNDLGKLNKSDLNPLSKLSENYQASSYHEKLKDQDILKVITINQSEWALLADRNVTYTFFFKEVPFHPAEDFINASNAKKGQHFEGVGDSDNYVWIPLKSLLKSNGLITFKALPSMVSNHSSASKNENITISLYKGFYDALKQPEMKQALEYVQQKPVPQSLIHKMQVNSKIRKEIIDRTDNLHSYNLSNKHFRYLLGDQYSSNPLENLNKAISLHNQKAIEASELINAKGLSSTKAIYKIGDFQKIQLEKMLKREQSKAGYISFYHAAPITFGFVYDVYTRFRKGLAGLGSENLVLFRGVDDLLNQFSTIDDLYLANKEANLEQKEGALSFDKTSLFRPNGLAANVFLFGNFLNLAEYTVHRWLNGYSDSENPNLHLQVLVAFLSQLGLPQDHIDKYKILFNKYFSKLSKDNLPHSKDLVLSNINEDKDRLLSVLYQILIPIDLINDNIKLSGSGGTPILEKNSYNKLSSLSSREILEKLANDQLSNYLNEHDQDNFFGELQARILLKPEMFLKDAIVYRYYSRPIASDHSQTVKDYQRELEKLVQEDLAYLLASNNRVNSQKSLSGHDSLFKLHDYVTSTLSVSQEVNDQVLADWFSFSQTDKLLNYYSSNPNMINKPLKKFELNLEPFKFSAEQIRQHMPTQFYPLQLAIFFEQEELIEYFLTNSSSETIQELCLKPMVNNQGYIYPVIGLLPARFKDLFINKAPYAALRSSLMVRSPDNSNLIIKFPNLTFLIALQEGLKDYNIIKNSLDLDKLSFSPIWDEANQKAFAKFISDFITHILELPEFQDQAHSGSQIDQDIYQILILNQNKEGKGFAINKLIKKIEANLKKQSNDFRKDVFNQTIVIPQFCRYLKKILTTSKDHVALKNLFDKEIESKQLDDRYREPIKEILNYTLMHNASS